MPPKEKPMNPPNQTAHVELANQDSLEARLARIESKLDSLGASNALSLASLLDKPSSADDSSPPLLSSSGTVSEGLTPETLDNSDPFNIFPLNEVLPVIDAYFANFNSVLPLFHQPSFMTLLQEFYSNSTQKSRVAWGIINCVLAMGFRLTSRDADPVQHDFSERRSQECVANAQKALDDFIVRDEDTLGVQGMLALVLLYHASPHHRPASVLISTAVRLAHRLQLHTRSSHAHFTPDQAKQRDNIFWICYTLDKEISVKAKIPSVQLDIDVDIDLPGSSPLDNDGVLRSVDGLSNFNYFRSRVRLAYLQGKIYDSLYSFRSKKLSPDERKQRVVQLDKMLDEWRQTIPTPLQFEHMAQTLDKHAIVHMTTLQHHYLLCLVCIHGIYSVDSEWVKAIGEFGRRTLEKMDNNTEICMKHMQPPLPSAWARLNIWALFSGVIILLANCQYYPRNDFVLQDQKLAKDGIKIITLTFKVRQDYDKLEQCLCVLRGLEAVAEKTIDWYQSHPDEIPYPPYSADNTYQPMVTSDPDNSSLISNYAATTQISDILPSWPDDQNIDSFDLGLVALDPFNEGAGTSPFQF
ncbi:hypothetical protein JX265_004266 [Neoarthrinium moseri]|uniref:Xylanolytic transcriptional activator regulatory domain-containing protein n=1 Tax=Neoarthrinium moseri TaxID=1658444 RepID=A0A9P9WQK0_9PEZI|nr:hypothetical protein JX265_004266 [Neoarthrinium moseri]